MKFTDSHCHLDFDELQQDFPRLLSACAKQKIHQLIIPSITPDNWQKVLNLTKRTQLPVKLFVALGIHPWFLTNLNEQNLITLSEKAHHHRQDIIAIGEAGIDGVIAEQHNNLNKQLHFFDYQLQLAQQQELPIIVHHRRSHQHIVPLLRKYRLNKSGVIHAFSGSYQQATAYIDLGFKLGIGGTITYPRAIKTIKAIKRLPLSALVLETDAPAMPLYGFQGQINSPLRILDIFHTLVAIRDEPAEQIAAQLELNIEQLFSLN
jgi:TatD DNase family protein